MKILKHAPRTSELLPKFASDPAMTLRILGAAKELKGDFLAYRHWEKVKYHRPLPDGFSPEAWWCALKMIRSATSQNLPLIGVGGKPVQHTWPADLAERLRILGARLGAKAPLGSAGSGLSVVSGLKGHMLIDESMSSSFIEGASTSREKAHELLSTARKPRDISERMIANNFRAIKHACAVASQSMTPDRLLEIHRLLTEDTLEDPGQVGRFRVEADKTVLRNGDEEVVFTPPPAGELAARVAKFCDFANASGPDSASMDPVLRAILLHFWVAYDHPFADGNGRTARAMFYWSMVRSGFPLVQHVSLSGAILGDSPAYYNAFQFVEADEDDATYFILNQVEMLEAALRKLDEEAEAKMPAGEIIGDRFSKIDGFNSRQQRFVVQNLGSPGSVHTLSGYKNAFEVTTMTAWRDLDGLLNAGLLDRGKKLGRAHAYVVPADLMSRIDLLAEGKRRPKKSRNRGLTNG